MLRTALRAAAGLALAFTLTACGQKGPLYKPEDEDEEGERKKKVSRRPPARTAA